uniref:Uncharacterized protein n=1 Tax=Candidatus Kentrum sp. FW TaxID=2126338 RepID=A0A450U4I4_9GAMM|nr:MAG: hypothetical protein BECKFW1821C_GA0114237_11894 [Candidatus Kentron sp. FW]
MSGVNTTTNLARPSRNQKRIHRIRRSPVETWDFFGETDLDPRIIDHDEVARLKRGLEREKLCYGPDDV